MKNRNAFLKFGSGAALAATAVASQAAVDVASVTSAITDAGIAAASVAGAVLVMLVGIKVFKWIRGAM